MATGEKEQTWGDGARREAQASEEESWRAHSGARLASHGCPRAREHGRSGLGGGTRPAEGEEPALRPDGAGGVG